MTDGSRTLRSPARAGLGTACLTLALLTALLAAPATGRAVDAGTCRVPTGEPAFDDGTDVQTWDGDVGDVTGGTLHVQAFHAGAYVAPWNRSSWQVEVAEHDPRDQLQATVDASTSSGRLSIRVEVEPRTGPLGVRTGIAGDAYAQVKVRVPVTAFREIVVFDEPQDANVTLGSVNGTDADWSTLRVHDLDADRLQIRSDNHGIAVTDGRLGEVVAETDNGQTALANVSGRRLEVTTDNGVGCLAEADYDAVTAATDNGKLTLHELTASTVEGRVDNGRLNVARANVSKLDVRVDNGDVRLETVRAGNVTVVGDNHDLVARGLSVREFTYRADNGNLDADVFPVASGAWDLATDNGEIELHVPTDDRHGYGVNVTTDNGDPTIDLPDSRVVAEGDGYLHVRTNGYDDRAIRTRIDVASDNGAVQTDDDTSSKPAGAALPVDSSTAAAGAATAASAAALLYLAWPKLKMAGAGLYTRLSRDEILDNPTRRRIVDVVQREPGIHFRALKRRLGAGRGILEHHLDKLVEADVLDESRGDAYRCYFPYGTVDRRVMNAADRLRSDGARAVLDAVRQTPGASVTEVAETADLSSSTAGYHLDQLSEAGLIEKARDGGSLAVDLTDLGDRTVRELHLT